MSDKPNSTSSSYDAMAPYWEMVGSILGGAKAMREKGEKYLPKFKSESDDNYKIRRDHAKFTNIFRDIVENLAQRPFVQEAVLSDDASDDFTDFAEDVNARGDSLHVFAAERFFDGIVNGVDWILVDYTKDVPEGATVAQEKELGVRPWWAHYPATSVLAAYSAMVDGREEFTHVRLKETKTVRDGFGEKIIERVRIYRREDLGQGRYGPATYEIWEEQQAENGEKDWVLLVEPTRVTIGVIPLVPFLTGRRKGKSWEVIPPMRDAADLQVELFQQESALKHAKIMTAFPMLTANGVSAPMEGGKPVPVPVGPHAVLYAPPAGDGKAGEWKFIEPSAQSLKFLAEDIKDTIKELRELGRQPLTAQSGNLTVITTAFAAKKGNAAIQAWSLALKDALENCLRFTAMWLRAEGQEPDVNIHTDFDLGWDENDGFEYLLTMRENEEISREELIQEAKRRNYLRAEYDAEADLSVILSENPDE